MIGVAYFVKSAGLGRVHQGAVLFKTGGDLQLLHLARENVFLTLLRCIPIVAQLSGARIN
jgi:hypothetical protein